MDRRRFAAASTVVTLLMISTVALAGDDGADVDVRASHTISAAASTAVTTPSDGSTPSTGAGTSVTSTTTIVSTSRPGAVAPPASPASTSTSVATTIGHAGPSTTLDDHHHHDDEDEDDDRDGAHDLGLRTIDVGPAGRVTVDGMVLVAVDARPGWTYEIDDVTTSRIRIEFVSGDVEVEFELEADGRLRIERKD